MGLENVSLDEALSCAFTPSAGRPVQAGGDSIRTDWADLIAVRRDGLFARLLVWRVANAWRYPQLGPGLTVSWLIDRVCSPTGHVDKPVETVDSPEVAVTAVTPGLSTALAARSARVRERLCGRSSTCRIR